MEPNSFGANLKRLREAMKYSQGDLAELSGVSRAGIANLEQGRREPTWAVAVKLAEALEVSLDEFRRDGAPAKQVRRGRPKGT